MTPAWRTWLPCLPQWSPAPGAQRKPTEDVQRLATRGLPSPQCQPRYAPSPICAGVPPSSIWATRPSEEAGGEHGWPRWHASQGSTKIGVKTR
jgi:hypothetical protein